MNEPFRRKGFDSASLCMQGLNRELWFRLWIITAVLAVCAGRLFRTVSSGSLARDRIRSLITLGVYVLSLPPYSSIRGASWCAYTVQGIRHPAEMSSSLVNVRRDGTLAISQCKDTIFNCVCQDEGVVFKEF